MSSAVNELWKEIEAWLEKNAPMVMEGLREGANAESILEMTSVFGSNIPQEYLDSLRRHNGEAELSDYQYLSTTSLISNASRLCERMKAGEFSEHEIFDPEAGIIENSWWSKFWIPFAKDSGANYFCIDLNPGPNGMLGQVLRHERLAGPVVTEFASFTDWLTDYRGKLLSGYYQVNEDGLIEEA